MGGCVGGFAGSSVPVNDERSLARIGILTLTGDSNEAANGF